MKKLTEVNASFGKLYRMLIASIRSKLLLTGIELKVFNQLSEPKSADVVAQVIGTHPGNTRFFLDGLVAIDLLQKKNGLYRNSFVAQAFLVEESPTFLGQFFTFMAWCDSPVLENLTKLVKEGPSSAPESWVSSRTFLGSLREFHFLRNRRVHSPSFASVMASLERVGYTQEAVQIVLNMPEFPSFQKMLDLGGGPGLLGVAIVDAHPNMKGVIFDLPSMVKVAETFIKEYGMEERMGVLSGDFNHDPIGEGYDLVWACASLQSASDIDLVVRKIYDALNPKGVFISIFPFGQTHERTKPEITVLSLLSVALMGQDMGVDQGYIANSMFRVGFKTIYSQTLDTPTGPMEIDIARK